MAWQESRAFPISLRSILKCWLIRLLSLSLFFLLESLTLGWTQPQYHKEGQWDFIPSKPKWRLDVYQPPPGGKDQKSPHYDPIITPNLVDDWAKTHGIHAALLYNPNTQQSWVILWGRGAISEDLSQPLSVYSTSCLLWRYDDNGPQPDYGYVRYLRDKYPYTDPRIPGNEDTHANIFCAGHNHLPDGRLFVTGGTYNPASGISDGLRTAYYFDPTLFDFNTPPSYSMNQGAPNYVGGQNQQGDARYWISDPSQPSSRMDQKRWYPSQLSLPDGRVLIVGGVQVNGSHPDILTTEYEMFDPCQWTFSNYGLDLSSQQDKDLGDEYPRLHLMSYEDAQGVIRGRVVYVGPHKPIYTLNPDNVGGRWTRQLPNLPNRQGRSAGTTVLLPNSNLNPKSAKKQVLDRVLVLGGHDECTVWNTGELIKIQSDGTLAKPSLEQPPDMSSPRKHLYAVLLPDGQVFVTGGMSTNDSEGNTCAGLSCPWTRCNYVLSTQLYSFDAPSNTWTVTDTAAITDEDAEALSPCTTLGWRTSDGARMYHSIALPLSDGRVLTAGTDMGGSPCPSDPLDPCYGLCGGSPADIVSRYPSLYRPPYLYKSDDTLRTDQERPRIDAVSLSTVVWGQTFNLLSTIPAGQTVQSVVLLRPSSVTHSVNFEQRLVRCYFKVIGGGTLEVTAPWSGYIAPPGWYMLFVVADENGVAVPSVAKWIQISAPPCTNAMTNGFTASFGDLGGTQSSPARATFEEYPITIAFRDPQSGTVQAVYTMSMEVPDAQSAVHLEFYSNLPAGSYEVYVRPYRTWLGRKQVVQWQPSGRLSLSLVNGGVTGDNRVDEQDLIAIGAALGSVGSDLLADLNKDGVVNELDTQIVLHHRGVVGDR